MPLHRGILSCVILLTFISHACALYFIHHSHLPLHHSLLPKHPIQLGHFDLLKTKEKRDIIHQLLHQATELTTAPQVTVASLKPEFMPNIAMSFPRHDPIAEIPATWLPHPSLLPQEMVIQSPQVAEETPLSWEELSSLHLHQNFEPKEFPLLTELLPEHGSYDGLETLASSDHFDVSVEYVSRQHKPGYIFKITFLPKSNILFKRICQNYFFLIDRSNSIPRARFNLNKEIVSQALEALRPQDTFNILLFDDKICRLSPYNLSWNEENVRKAREFLLSEGHGGYFAATELYSSLKKILPDHVSDHEVNTAFLLSDGDTYLSLEKQRQTIGEWTLKNQGKVSLYAAASGGGNNLPLLELISSFNKGMLIYSYDPGQFMQRMAQLLHSIRHPIGKEMVATAITSDKQTVVLLQPKSQRLPELYQNRPFVVYGSINRLSDFVLFLQGKYYDQRFDIKKNISFEQAKVGTSLLEKSWTQLVVQEFYDRFFEDGNPKHLEAAKHMLLPLHLPLPFGE